MAEKELKIYLRLSDDMANRFLRVKEHLGLRNDTEVIRSLINWYWRQHREELLPPLQHFNLNGEGVLILDRTLRPSRVIQVYFRPEGPSCELCESRRCRHVEFALNIPKVQDILREKGWKVEE